MILDHIGFGNEFYRWSHAFHMPLFFLVTGYFFRADKVKEHPGKYIGKKAKALLVPYIVVSLICYVAWLLIKHDKPWYDPLIHIFWNNQSGIPIATAVWFLMCLFMLEVMFVCIIRLTRAKPLHALAWCLFISLGAYLLIQLWDVELPWCTIPAMMALPLLWCGWQFQNLPAHIREKCIKMPWGLLIALLVMTTASIFLHASINMRSNNYGIYPLFYLNACLATFLMWVIINRFRHIEGNFLAKGLSFMGRTSLVYLCVNQAGITATEILFTKFLPPDSIAFRAVSVVVVLSGCTCCAFIWNLILKKRSNRRHQHEH